MSVFTEQDIINACSRFQFDENYYSDTEYVSNSMLSRLKDSPKNLAHYLLHGAETTPAMIFGRAFHCWVLEPDVFWDNIAVFEGKTRRGNAWNDFCKENENKDIITTSEMSKFQELSKILHASEDIQGLLEGVKEAPMVWLDETTGIKCKGKADVFSKKANTIIDIKTTTKASLNEFRRHAYKYGYNRQAAFYMDGFGADRFMFIVIEKSAPYNFGIYECSQEFINSGREDYKELLVTYDEYFIEKTLDINKYYYTGEL